MSSSIWDWAASLTGLRSSENLFLPTYWCTPSELTISGGWVFEPAAILWVLSLVSLLGVAGYLWKRRSGFLHLSVAIWGALLADTPYVVFLPLTLVAAWFVILRLAKLLKRDVKELHAIPWKRLGGVCCVAFLAVFAANLARCGISYIPGYAKNALVALRWDGGWHPFDTSKMDGLLDDYVTELAREAEGKKWIFTDGLCDTGIELKGSVRAVSLSEGGRDEAYWRGLGFVRQEDLSALESGSSSLLRAWAVDHPGELTNAVFQCGFAFLEREAAGKLEPYGLVLRSPVDATSPSRQEALSTLRSLAGGIVAFYRDGGKPEHGGFVRQARFCAMQWRVARAMRRQATVLDRAKLTKEALAATALSEELDRLNPYAHRQTGTTEAVDLRAFGSLTPREGLDFALRRANFALARKFALPIVKDEPENPEANFALAMSHLVMREHAQARHYFAIALKARPNDPVLLNNLAVSSLMLGDLKDAEEQAKAALKAKPDSEAIKDTLKKVQSAREKK